MNYITNLRRKILRIYFERQIPRITVSFTVKKFTMAYILSKPLRGRVFRKLSADSQLLWWLTEGSKMAKIWLTQ